MFLVAIVAGVFLFAGGAFGEDSLSRLDDQAVVATDAGNFDAALKLYKQELQVVATKDWTLGAARIHTRMAEIQHLCGRFPEAEADYNTGLDLLSKSTAPQDPVSIRLLDGLGWLYITWGRYDRGARLMDEAETKVKHAKLSTPALLNHMDAYASYRSSQGKLSDARREWERAIRIAESAYGPQSAEYDYLLLHLGQASVLYRDYETATEMFSKVLETDKPSDGAATLTYAMAAAELGHVYVLLNKVSKASPQFDTALRFIADHPEDSPLSQSTMTSYLGDYYMAQKDWNEAETQYRASLTIRQRILGKSNAVADSMLSLSTALKKLHRRAEAKELEASAKAILAPGQNQASEQTVDVLALRSRQ